MNGYKDFSPWSWLVGSRTDAFYLLLTVIRIVTTDLYLQ